MNSLSAIAHSALRFEFEWLGREPLLVRTLLGCSFFTLLATTAASGSLLIGVPASFMVAICLSYMSRTSLHLRATGITSENRPQVAASILTATLAAAIACGPLAWVVFRGDIRVAVLALHVGGILIPISMLVGFMVLVLLLPHIVIGMASANYRATRRHAVSDKEVEVLTALTWMFHCGLCVSSSGAF